MSKLTCEKEKFSRERRCETAKLGTSKKVRGIGENEQKKEIPEVEARVTEDGGE